ncbi:MAG TPA: hypothetical protein VGN42_12140, partial [Pirellulales bacterium]|nr:hypothetical protein [Pirellulales bacterium]
VSATECRSYRIGDDCIGRPHCGQVIAWRDRSRPQSGQGSRLGFGAGARLLAEDRLNTTGTMTAASIRDSTPPTMNNSNRLMPNIAIGSPSSLGRLRFKYCERHQPGGEFIGRPHCGQLVAIRETNRPQSRQGNRFGFGAELRFRVEVRINTTRTTAPASMNKAANATITSSIGFKANIVGPAGINSPKRRAFRLSIPTRGERLPLAFCDPDLRPTNTC